MIDRVKIVNRFSGEVICDGPDVSSAVTTAVGLNAELSHANLSHANLSHANLSHANLSHANLSHANLSHANLSRANLSHAKINWRDHWLVSHILFHAAGDSIARRKVAALVAVSTDWCWEKFLSIEDDERLWAIDTLSGYVVDGDESPVLVRSWAEKKKAVAK